MSEVPLHGSYEKPRPGGPTAYRSQYGRLNHTKFASLAFESAAPRSFRSGCLQESASDLISQNILIN